MTDVNIQSVDVEFTLPEDKIPDLHRVLNLEGLAKDVPPALTAEFRDLRHNDLRGPDGFRPFNAMQHMQKLDQIQQSIAARAYQKEQLKRYGEHFAALNRPKMTKWPSATGGPVPVPNPSTLPFPYAGVEGVLTPRYKPPPERKRTHLELEENDVWEDLTQLGHRVTPVQPTLLFAKDGCDMNLQSLQTDIYRMEAGVKELGRVADIQKLEREVEDFARDRRAPQAVSRRLFDVELTVQENQRVLEELQWNRRLEEEQLFWVERKNRNRYYHDLYTGKLEGELKKQMQSKHPTELDHAKVEAKKRYVENDFFDDLRRGRASFDVEITRIVVSLSPHASEADKHAYRSISGLYEWMGSYGTERQGMVFIKQGDKKGRPRIQYNISEGRWIIAREDGSVLCRSDNQALKSPTEATWTSPDLIVAYQSDEVTVTKRGDRGVFDLGSAYGRPVPPSRGRQRTNLAQYEEWLLNQQISKDNALEADLTEAARREDAEEYEEDIESDQHSEKEVVFDDDDAFHQISTRPQAISATEASQIDVCPMEEGYLESAFNYLYDVVMGDEDKAETDAILREENVVISYATLDLPEKRARYGFDPSAFWEQWQPKELDPAKVYDGTALCKALIAQHRRGKIGAHGGQEGAQAVFEFLWAASKEKVGGAEGMRRIGLISDIFHKYPYKAFPIYYWAIETMIFLYNQQPPLYQHQFARPIFGICGYVARVTFDAPCFSVHTRLLAALAMSVSDTSIVTGTHVAFVLRRYSERRTRLKGNLLVASIEYILQFLMVAHSPRLLRSQVSLVLEVMKSFKFNAKMAVRSLLCFASLYELGDSRCANHEQDEKAVLSLAWNSSRTPKQSIIDKLIHPEGMHIRTVVDICDLYMDDRKVQGAGCKALVAAAALNKDQVRTVVHYGGLRAILYAAKRFPVSSAISLGLAEMYLLAAKTAPEELVTEHLFKACTSVMVYHAKDPQVVQTCAKAMALSSTIIRRALFSEVQQGLQWKDQTLCQFLLVAERHLYDAKTAGEVFKLLRALAQDDVRLFSSGRSPMAALCMKAVEECPTVIPSAMEIYNRLMHDRNTFDVDIVRQCDSLARIVHVFSRLGPEKSLTAEQTRWLMLTIGNIALCDTQSVQTLWRNMSPRHMWAYLKTAILRVNVEDSDVIAQSSRAMTLLLNIEDPLGRDEPPPPSENKENRTAETRSFGVKPERDWQGVGAENVVV